MSGNVVSAGKLSVAYDPARGTIGDEGGFFVRDIQAWSALERFDEGFCEPLGLRLAADVSADDKAIAVSGQIIDITGRDRAVTLAFSIPVEPKGWTWHDDPRRSRPIQRREVFGNEIHVGTGSDGSMSQYPLGCITSGQRGLAIGLDMDVPAQFHIVFDGAVGELKIVFDFGLSAETTNFPQAAPFRFVLFGFDGREGFRGALQAYYDIFPEHFVCRSREQGIWMAFGDVSDVEDHQDFGFKYHEGVGNLAFDNAEGILSFRYCEPSTFWMAMDPAIPRTQENVAAELQRWADSDDPAKRAQAEAVRVAASHNEHGQLNYYVMTKPWCDGVVFSMNPSPHLPGGNEASLYWNEQVRDQYYGPAAKARLDGEYLDSLEAYVTVDENHRREHFRHVTIPLTFSTTGRQPVIHKAMSVWEFLKSLADDLHAMDRLTFANDAAKRFVYLAPHLDVLGIEIGWIDENGRWRPPDDAWMLVKRAMCRHKPYLFLLNAQFDLCRTEDMDRYFQRCLFYGMWPSMFSHNAMHDTYWSRAEWYERDRPIFKRYMPLIRRVAEAGWEPITGATVDSDTVYVERFGPDDDGRVFFTLLNDSFDERTVRVTISSRKLGITPSASAKELVTGGRLTAGSEGEDLVVSLDMPGESVRVVVI